MVIFKPAQQGKRALAAGAGQYKRSAAQGCGLLTDAPGCAGPKEDAGGSSEFKRHQLPPSGDGLTDSILKAAIQPPSQGDIFWTKK
jgi:hypothetical protein